jgi:tetratricopeptide (TPR) repeat protein
MNWCSEAMVGPTALPSGRLDSVIEQILQADRLMQVDQVDKARDIYQRIVELDPGNAIAVVGLARCALADGDDQQAHELASKALTIDPENDMARRMEARLSEIFSTRGEPVERPEAAATPGTQKMRPVVTDTADASPGVTSPTSPSTIPPADPSPTARPIMHKSLFDRLLGR